MNESLSYQKMLEEVEDIIKEISATDMDLDLLVGKVEKGYSLIQCMKERLQSAKDRIDDLHKKYEET
ncbi:MAG: exodeoxyribonuclease VII small subunit [Oligoflexales bacterium]|nr:exodeoxyribonuclease VII small subunit [Oligoflexales bacterium]